MLEDDEDLNDWPDFFEVNEHVPKILKAELKHPPKIRSAQTMSDLLDQYDIKKNLHERLDTQNESKEGYYNNALEQPAVVERTEIQQEEREQQIEALSQHGVNEETANKIILKQELEKEAKQRNDKMQEEAIQKGQIEEHIRIADGMRTVFMTKEKKGMWQAEIIDQLHMNPDGISTSKEDMKATIMTISKIFPDALKIFNIPKGTFLRMDTSRMQVLQIQERVKKHFEEE